MNKSLALLKDSFREALDGKVLFVLLCLSSVFLFLVSSISYTPVGEKRAFGDAIRKFTSAHARRGIDMPTCYSPTSYDLVDEIEVVADADHPARRKYRIRFEISGKDAIARETAVVWYWQSTESRMNRPPRSRPEEVKSPEGFSTTPELVEEFLRAGFLDRLNIPLAEFSVVDQSDATKKVYEVVTEPATDTRGWGHSPSLFFGALDLKQVSVPLGSMLFLIQDTLLNGLGAVIAILCGVIVTGSFIPNMLRKGSIDLLLSKPLGRVQIIFYKYLGGLSFMAVFAGFNVLGLWLILGLRAGVWSTEFLLMIPMLTFSFSVLYAVSTMAGLWTRSTIVSIMATLIFAVSVWLFGTLYVAADTFNTAIPGELPPTLLKVMKGIHTVLPRTKDVDVMTTKVLSDSLLSRNERAQTNQFDVRMPDPWSTFGVSILWIAVFLGIGCWIMVRRDY